jgi:hypothetical protein
MTETGQNTRYRVLGPDHEEVDRGQRLEDAFARMMHKAGTEFVISRHGRKMRLSMMRTSFWDMPFLDFDSADDRAMLRELFPLIESDNLDDAEARREIMLKMIDIGRDNYRCEIDLSVVASP